MIELFTAQTISEFLTSIAYFSIPVTIIIFMKKRKQIDYKWMYICFILFIMLCGIGHLMHVIGNLVPTKSFHSAHNLIMILTAAISIVTAILLWRIIPQLLRIPSPSELEKANKEILQLAHYDSLTGLVNRNYFQIIMEKTITEAKENQYQLAVVFIDLDRFKVINDTYGHGVGDLLLKQVSKRIVSNVRKEDIVSRQSGDEFILLLQDISCVETEKIMNRISQSLSPPFILDGIEIHCTPSIGISCFPSDGTEAETLITYADVAMYKAKEKGRNNYQFFTKEMSEEISKKLALENQLRKAVEEDQLQVYYQPQLDLKTNRIVATEALLRWCHPEKGFISPMDFIPLSEETGLILPIGEWVLNEACKQTKTWRDQGFDLSVSVNLSNRQLINEHIVETIEKVLLHSELDPKHVTLEITESVAIVNLTDTLHKLKKLQDFGINISLDDFGTGYSSLSYLSILPITSVKIDQSFIKDIEDSAKREMVKSIGNIAHSIGLKVVAEGIEDEQQFNIIRSLGLEMIQGYYVSHPIPEAEMKAKLIEMNTNSNRDCL
ncbi:EAL domain-containing protein [Bacillus sp. V3B]|uniref:putative bifunctional diguanylate cyclase/phosphodiesterase n=1 Tax=Bacillus sp. V3B TaxID=2804915 RepID=UPI00210A6B72|nr:EAL domain-containing protein [Bacillus sp. V3B]MCQ6277567.1 EAL domain-containing protein [Bacillus sp. V3B]